MRHARLLVFAFSFSLVFTGFSDAARAQGRALTIEDYYSVKTVGPPRLSDDGRWVAYTVSHRNEAIDGDSSEVWLARFDGSTRSTRVSRPGTHAVNPDWSNGRLTFSAGGQRWSIDPSNPGVIAASPSVVPPRAGGRTIVGTDGEHVAELRNVAVPRREPEPRSDFEKRHAARFKGKEIDWLNFQRDGSPFPVPNRVDPVLYPAQEIWTSTAGAGMSTPPTQRTSLGLRPAGVQWNANGSRLLFTADSGYRDERRYEKGDIYEVELDGPVRRLTNDADYNYTNAHYSPDGQWILYTRQLSTNAIIGKRLNHGGPVDLAVMPSGGGAERILTADWDYLPSNPTWGPDSRTVYFSGGIGGTTHLFRVPATGGQVTQVTTGQRRVASVAFDSAFKRIAYTVGQFESPSEIYVANANGTAERQLTHVHDELTKEIAFTKGERLLFTSKDGTPLEGWLFYPYNYRATGGPYPLVVSSHGGPHSADGYGFNFKDQYFAANGYFVLQVNFRSSTGYGEHFLWATWGAWGDRDGEDVMAGIDYVLSRNPIDRTRVATMGHSYGGFMTNWLITQYPDRFAAAISGAGIVNWMSDYGTADIPRTKEMEFYGAPWDSTARAIMIRQSPLTYADRVRTPTLFVNGEADHRVPFSENEQMFVALRKHGVPAKMITYEGMPHNISGSWNNVYRMLNDLRWLDTWLKPGNR